MSHRWSPGRGFIRVIDCGDLAVWMRPEPGGGVTIAQYTPDYWGGDPGRWALVWRVRASRGSWLPYEVMDKPHRIRWVLGADPAYLEFGGEVLDHRRVPPSHRGHRRLNRRRKVWRWPLPRPIQRALDEGSRR